MTKDNLNRTMDDVVDALDAAAKAFPIKALAPEIKGDLTASKAESTLRNELNQQPGYKLGLLTAVQIMHHTRDLKALDMIEAHFGRTAWKVPEVHHEDPVPLMGRCARLSKEFADVIEAASEAMRDGRVQRAEAEKMVKEIDELVTASIRMKAVLQAMDRSWP